MKKLLVPTDFSETSEYAIGFAVQLARKCQYRIILLHTLDFPIVYDSFYMDGVSLRAFTKEISENASVKLDNLLRKHRADGLKIETRTHEGSLVDGVTHLVENEGIDLIVMGTRGATGIKELLVGSNTEKIVRLANCPVISVPQATDVSTVRRIVVPIDLREIQATFLKEVSVLQQLFSASVEFVWVKTPHYVENLELVAEEVNNLLGEYDIASSSFTIIKDVFPDEGIRKYAENTKADMLAMATHARRGIAHFFSGSLTEDVLNHSSVPVWTFRLDKDEKPINLEAYQELHYPDDLPTII
jgi:nucleotide-binding universal stress UspA family protein